MKIIVDGNKAERSENKLYKGAGMVSANNSSRLLLDYKWEHPKAYDKLLALIFGEKGIGVNHLKIEMGADINSSSGTEPNVMRTEDEKPDVTRGAGFQLAADVKKINSDLTLDMLYWSEPLWVTNSDDVYNARYKWYKSILDAAYETYGLKFDYVSAVRNERESDPEWIKYLSKRLRSEKNCPYNYSEIKVVAGEEVCTWNIADRMLEDEELMKAIDVVGSHYTSHATDNSKRLADEFGKELWFSEASSPMSYGKGSRRFDGTGSGMSDVNGLLDIANRFITMYYGGYMTLCEYQPVISAYYDGVTYCHKQLIIADTPWSGHYTLDSGFYMSLHFSQFIKKGWSFINGACFGDGVKGGDGHAIVNATYSYMTAADMISGDYSSVITNTTASPLTYQFEVKNLGRASAEVYVWETAGAEGSDWKKNHFRKREAITPEKNGDSFIYSVTVKPYSLVTISTVDVNESDYDYSEGESPLLMLPYTDDFEYSGYPESYLSSRGNAPRYTTDEGGAFEVENIGGNNVLVQKITPDIKSEEWGGTPQPTTNFGDDRWFNYSISCDIGLTESDSPENNYGGVGLRYNLADSGESGYWLQIYENGKWKLRRNSIEKLSGCCDKFDCSIFHKLKIEAYYNTVKGYIDGVLLFEYDGDESGEPMLSAGRAALYSSYNRNSFDNIEILPSEDTYIERYDDTDLCFIYEGEWNHVTMSSFRNYKRTISEGKAESSLSFSFKGNSFAMTGICEEAVIAVSVDGENEAEAVIKNCGSREAFCYRKNLGNKEHIVRLRIVSGALSVDGAQASVLLT